MRFICECVRPADVTRLSGGFCLSHVSVYLIEDALLFGRERAACNAFSICFCGGQQLVSIFPLMECLLLCDSWRELRCSTAGTTIANDYFARLSSGGLRAGPLPPSS